MDTITRRSAYVSTALHASLVALALWPRGCGCSQVQPPRHPEMKAEAAPAPVAPAPREPGAEHRAAARLVLAPANAPPPSPPLPTLGPGGLPALPIDPLQLITPANTDHPGAADGRGAGGGTAAGAGLPQLPSRGEDLLGQLRSRRTSNEELSREERTLKTAQEFLEGLLNVQVHGRWRHLAGRLTEPRLIIEAMAARDGTVEAHLLNSSGVQELDQAIEGWLRSPDLRLPAIRPDVRYPFLVVIRR